VDFSRAVTETEAQTKDRTLPEKTPPPAPPTPPSLSIAQAPKARAPDMPTLVPRLVRDLRLAGGLELGEPVSDSDAIPLVRIEPRYPSRAQARGIEGWVRVIFTISPAGTVVDEYIADSDPPRIFDSAALRAVRKWKYKPRIVNGKPVERRDVEVTLRFEIED
jgi:protein TonB